MDLRPYGEIRAEEVKDLNQVGRGIIALKIRIFSEEAENLIDPAIGTLTLCPGGINFAVFFSRHKRRQRMEDISSTPFIEAKEIISLRKALGWSQGKLAREVGVSESTLGKWEHGQVPPDKYIWKIRRFLAALESLNRARKEIASKFPNDYHRG